MPGRPSRSKLDRVATPLTGNDQLDLVLTQWAAARRTRRIEDVEPDLRREGCGKVGFQRLSVESAVRTNLFAERTQEAAVKFALRNSLGEGANGGAVVGVARRRS